MLGAMPISPATPILLTEDDQERLKIEGVLRVMEHVGSDPQRIESALFDTLYEERRRLEKEHDRDKARAQRQFYDQIQAEALRANAQRQRQLLKRIVESFAAEVAGHFDPRFYALATKVVPTGLSVLLNAMSPIELVRAASHGFRTLEERIVVGGEVDAVQRAARHGTVVLVPTHSSNLDSILLGYGIMRMGLPPFLYGAGLNLFEHKFIGIFMHNLGAYTVDRRKQAWVYKEVLKTYAGCTMELGLHNLFFPGGTRSRSGAVETKLKLGLVSTALEAYINNLRRVTERPDVFIVPCTLNYQIVLEGETLIDDHLKEVGKSRYIIEDDEFSKPRRIIDFITKLFALDSRIHMIVSRPMDLFGNTIDDECRSRDRRGRVVDRRKYVMIDGAPAHDGQRDQEYVREIGRAIVERFHRDTVVDATKVLSHVMFEWLREENRDMDVYRLLRTGGAVESLPLSEAHERVDRMLGALRALAADGRARLDDTVAGRDATKVIDEALAHLGCYHRRPAVARRGDRLFHVDRNLLLYYQNRLSGFDLAAGGGRP
jgi:glycerol-3-phosphate O-acyltransferase